MPVLKQIVAAEAHARSPTAVLVSRLGTTALAARSDSCFDAFLDGASWYVQLPALTPHGLTTPCPPSFLDRMSCMSPAMSIAAEDTVQLQNCLRTVALVTAQAKAKVRRPAPPCPHCKMCVSDPPRTCQNAVKAARVEKQMATLEALTASQPAGDALPTATGEPSHAASRHVVTARVRSTEDDLEPDMMLSDSSSDEDVAARFCMVPNAQ